MQKAEQPAASEAADAQHGAEMSSDEVASGLGAMAVTGDEEANSGEPGAKSGEQESGEPGAESAEADSGEQESGEQESGAEQGDDGAAEARIPKARLDREIAKTREQRERAEALEQQLAERQQLDAETAAKVAESIALDPSYLAPADQKLVLRANQIEAELNQLVDNWDGVEDADPAKTRTAQQVRQAWARLNAEYTRISPLATTAYQSAHKQMLADMQEGRKLRLARKSVATAQAVKPTGNTKPPAPVRPTSAPARPIAAGPTKRGPDIGRFTKAGATREAAARELAELVPPD